MPAITFELPAFSASQAELLACVRFGIAATATVLPSERDQNFLLTTGDGERFVLKIANVSEDRAVLELQNRALAHIAETDPSIVLPRVRQSFDGKDIEEAAAEDGRTHLVRLLTWVDGEVLANVQPHLPPLLESLGTLLGRIDNALESFEHPAATRDLKWDATRASWIADHFGEVSDETKRQRAERLFHWAWDELVRLSPSLPTSVIYNDANDHNVLVTGETAEDWHVASVVDFGDILHAWTVNEVAVAAAYAALDHPDPLSAIRAVLKGYHATHPLGEEEIDAVFPLVCSRLCVSVVNSAIQRRADPGNKYLVISERPAWDAIEQLARLEPLSVQSALRGVCGVGSAPGSAAHTTELLAARAAHIGPSLSVSYDTPLTIVRGWMQYLYDADGRAYLDAVNNVAHVGHCHPFVVQAGQRQMALLNTNTRYLHEHLGRYAERLTATLPDPLRVCYFVNSGSEANELALRLARAATGSRETIVVDVAYHGNTTGLVDISPYKFDGPGGAGAPPHVHKVPTPDVYRGIHRGTADDPGARYAAHVAEMAEIIVSCGLKPGAFIAESILSCAGQIILPPGYLAAAYKAVRAAGGVCIADEVQVGFGRAGTHFWAFETQGVVPDIVTMGKPIGNGHPLGAVVTTPAIAQAFTNGMEYFNTFGGNPVSCAIGMAVLDVIESERLQDHARNVGAALLVRLNGLKWSHTSIGDVRGLGLFLGVELVRDRVTLEPDARLAGRVANRMRDHGVLVSTDGPFHNVLKIKPPLVFNDRDAELLADTLDAALREG